MAVLSSASSAVSLSIDDYALISYLMASMSILVLILLSYSFRAAIYWSSFFFIISSSMFIFLYFYT